MRHDRYVRREANAALKLPEIRDKVTGWALDVIPELPEYFADFICADHVRYGKIAKEIGLKPQ